MKMFEAKSFVAGVLVGALGLTTAFGATGIKSAGLNDMTITLKGASLSLDRSLVWVSINDEENPSLYVPADEVFEKLGYGVHYDNVRKTVDLIPGEVGSREIAGDVAAQGKVVLNLANHAGQKNIAESGSFQAEQNQALVLTITSDIQGGAVDLFLFDPAGREQHITIGSGDLSKEIPLEKGTWMYNCSGLFKDGGNVKIVGTLREG